ncbi:MAG: hypothetical protein WBG46_08965 [Nonlabens sp.]
MKLLYNLSFLLFLVPALALAGNGKGKYTKSKKLSQEYALAADGLLKISNSFGNVTIATWDQPQVTFDITVEVSGDNEDKVDDRLRNIDIRFSTSDGYVEARTKTDDNNYSNDSWSFWDLFKSNSNNSSSGNLKINYVVRMPVTARLDITNDYGAIILDKLEGKADISCDFGRLDIGQLLAQDNELSFDYTKNSNIDYMKSGLIKADFSDFDLYGCDKLEFRGDYTKARLHKTTLLDFNSDFSTVISDESSRITGRGDYSTIRFGNVAEILELTTDFGTIKVDELGPEIKSVLIRSDYTGITLGYNSQASFNFDIDTEFASIKVSEDLEIRRSENDHTEKRLSGFAKNQNSGNTINIKSEFGGVSLKMN